MDVRDLPALLDCIRFVRRTAVQTAVHLITPASCSPCSRASR
jgi:hypothetical protein